MKRLYPLLVLVFLASACAPTRVPPPKTAQSYFAEGENFYEKGLYEEAVASWEKVRESYHSPELTTLAEMKIAEAHFRAEHYAEAATAYEDFLKQHPDHEQTPEILYQLGMSYYHQMLAVDRDQTATRNALATFETLGKRFPDHPRSKEIRPFIQTILDNLAAHELYVGEFYLRTDNSQAAIRRLEGLFRTYPNYYSRDKAFFLLGQAYLKAGREKEAKQTFNTLYRDFPGSEYIIPAQRILEKHL